MTISAILFWGFLVAALIWLIAWLFLRQYFVDEAGVTPNSQPLREEIRHMEEPDQPGEQGHLGGSQSNAVDRGDGGATEFSDALASGHARLDDELGVVYLSAPEQIDDLKLIKGVGGVLEDKLHEFGVYHYEQIAHWRQRVVDEFNDRLAFKGRIERDSWIDQARELHQKKYESST